jgi:intracellular sulfur oxidation DsrE/DsrF family protein
MKRNILTGLLLFLSAFLMAQKTPYNVVFDITSKDTIDHKMVIRWLDEITKADANAKLEVVFYAQSLDMVTKGKSVVAKQVEEYAKNKNVSFRVCEVAMKNNNVDKSQLLAGVQTVPDGIYEVISKQAQGYGYIKATR